MKRVKPSVGSITSPASSAVSAVRTFTHQPCNSNAGGVVSMVVLAVAVVSMVVLAVAVV